MYEVVIETLDEINERMAIEAKLLEGDIDLTEQLEAYAAVLEIGEEYAEEESEGKEEAGYWENLFCPESESELSF